MPESEVKSEQPLVIEKPITEEPVPLVRSEKKVVFDFRLGMKTQQVIKVMNEKALEMGKSEEDLVTFNRLFRESIKKKTGMFSKRELDRYKKSLKEWLENATE